MASKVALATEVKVIDQSQNAMSAAKNKLAIPKARKSRNDAGRSGAAVAGSRCIHRNKTGRAKNNR